MKLSVKIFFTFLLTGAITLPAVTHAQSDAIEDATLIHPLATEDFFITADLAEATNTPFLIAGHSEFACPHRPGDKDMWFKFTAQSNTYSIELIDESFMPDYLPGYEASFSVFRKSQYGDTMIKISSLCQTLSVSEWGSSSTGIDGERNTYLKGETYYIRLHSGVEDSELSLPIKLRISYTPTTLPNDDIENAVAITVGASCSSTINIGLASLSKDEKTAECIRESLMIDESASLWYRFTAPPSGLVRISTDIEGATGNVHKTRLALYQKGDGEASDYNNYSIIGCGAPDYSEFSDLVNRGTLFSPVLTPGTEYYIQVLIDQRDPEEDEFCIEVTELESDDISANTSCSLALHSEYTHDYYDPFNRYTSWYMLRYMNYSTYRNHIIAQIKNESSGLHLNENISYAQGIRTGSLRSTSDGRLYSNIYYSFKNDDSDATGTYDLILYIRESELSALELNDHNFTMTRVNSYCTPSLSDTDTTDIIPTATGLTPSGDIRWIAFSTDELGTFYIRKNLPLTVTPETVNVSCNGGSNGKIVISAAGGVPPYTYDWSSEGLSGPVADSLTAGIYGCIVMDAAGASDTITITISEPAIIETSLSLTACLGDSILIDGIAYYEDGHIPVTYTADNGCDSTVTYSLVFENISIAEDMISKTGIQNSGSAYFSNSSCEAVAVISSTSDLGLISLSSYKRESVSVSSPFVNRYFGINAENNSPASITLYFSEDDFAAYNALVGTDHPDFPPISSSANNLQVTAFHGEVTEDTPAIIYESLDSEVLDCTSTWNSTQNRWEVTFFTPGFSYFFLHTNAHGEPLPVNFIDVNARREEDTHIISWTISEHKADKSFEIEKSPDARSFKTAGYITPETKDQTEFTFTNHIKENSDLYYRIAYTSSGSDEKAYSRIVKVSAPDHSSQINIYPNPASDILNVQVNTTGQKSMTVKVSDLHGRIIMEDTSESGFMQLSLKNFTSGQYIIQVMTEEENSTFKFIKQ